ncbi:BgTH12-06262 [Blumeria graminis f. sp. triticale]|uniref:BgtE-50667 n=2 Tax=Blumeria graminis TaxID=34373 RepID=A0A9X9LAI7_BLUGR|nr:BgTH12-06262 [Blumeria graminis f. sp. triticale]VCU40816.1 BgtE-50667 [Blumeria graminis f. sp. tritici]
MKSANLASLSFFFGFFILESAAVYVCPGGAQIPDSDVETRANQIYSKGLSLNAKRTPGQDQVEDIVFDDDEGDLEEDDDDAGLSFMSDFKPQITSSSTYKIIIKHPSKKIVLLEYRVSGGGRNTSLCTKN